MHGARDRLDEHGPLVGQLVRNRMELTAVGGELLAPAAAGVAAEAGLQPGLEVPDGDPVAAVREARWAGRARLDAARGALQDRVDHHSGAGRQVLALGRRARPRPRGRARAASRRAPRSRGLVRPDSAPRSRAADAGQTRPQPRPARAVHARLVDRDHAQRCDRAGQDSGDRGRRRPSPPRDGAPTGTSRVQASCALTCRSEGASDGARARPVDDRPVALLRVPEQGDVGLHGDRVADRREQRQVGVRVGVGEARGSGRCHAAEA